MDAVTYVRFDIRRMTQQYKFVGNGICTSVWALSCHTTQHSTWGRCQQLHGRRSQESILDSVTGFLAWWAKGPLQPVSRGPGVFPSMVELQGGLWAHGRIPGSHHGRAGVCEDHLFCGLQIIHLRQQRGPDPLCACYTSCSLACCASWTSTWKAINTSGSSGTWMHIPGPTSTSTAACDGCGPAFWIITRRPARRPLWNEA